MHSRTTRTLLAAPFLIANSLLPSCYAPLNTAPTVAKGVPLDTLTPWPSVFASEAAPPPPPDEVGGPKSVVTVERRNWRPMVFLVPIAGVKHQPHYTLEAPVFAKEIARQRSEFPTIKTALERTTKRSDHRQAIDIIVAPFFAAGDIVLFIPRAIATPPWKTIQSPYDPYERAPEKPLRLRSGRTTALLP